MTPFEANARVIRWHCNASPKMRAAKFTVQTHVKQMAFFAYRMGWISESDFNAIISGEVPEGVLARAILHHDCHEAILGDLPAPAKTMFRGLADAYLAAVAAVNELYGWNVPLSQQDQARLYFLDKLSAYEEVQVGDPDLLSTEEWLDAREDLIRRATILNVDIRRFL